MANKYLKSFNQWLNENFVFINGYYYGCPIKYEGMLLTKDYLKEIYNEQEKEITQKDLWERLNGCQREENVRFREKRRVNEQNKAI